jgi:predicted transposase YdaD
VKTDHWFYGLFQAAPDLITLLLPAAGASAAPPPPSLAADAPGDALYRFEAPELKAVNHRLDGVLWPRGNERGTPEQPVVLLEVQMQGKPGFKHRLAAQSFRFLQLHPQLQCLEVVVVVPHRRLRLGPTELPSQLESFLAGVNWLSLEELGQQPGLDPLVSLLTLPVRPMPEIPGATDQILRPRPDLLDTVLSILGERFPNFTREEIMALINLPTDHLRGTRFGQELIEEGRLEGEARGRAAEAASVALRQLNLLCGPLSETTTARIQALPLAQLESLADALLDFSGPSDLAAWLAQHGG